MKVYHTYILCLIAIFPEAILNMGVVIRPESRIGGWRRRSPITRYAASVGEYNRVISHYPLG